MKRDVSTSTIGRDERKPALDAYMFERRMLLACSFLFGLSLIAWIVAISTDHWIIISGIGGIFIPETRRFFMSSHSGLWRHCRYTTVPYALPNASVARNFTSIAYQNPTVLSDAKISLSDDSFIKDFLMEDEQFPIVNITDETKQRMFAHWVRGDTEFHDYKRAFWNITILPNSNYNIILKNKQPIKLNPLDVQGLRSPSFFGESLVEVKINATNYFIVIPPAAREAMFEGWNEKRVVPKLYWPYVRDLNLPAYVTDAEGTILQLIPPKPEKKKKIAHGYEYVPNRKCKYIEMFPTEGSLKNDPGVDDELLDYIRSQASFACITVFVMGLGSIFSFYTFLNPRYMFKRLAGGIHLVAASTVMVVIQVLVSSVDYTREHLFFAYPEGAELIYGYGVYLAWFTFLTNIFAGLMFLWYSGKKKGSKAATEELAMADEATIIGR